MSTNDDRISELESRVAFLEDANQQMSDLLYLQQKQIDSHIRETTQLLERLLEDSGADASKEDPPPPHY